MPELRPRILGVWTGFRGPGMLLPRRCPTIPGVTGLLFRDEGELEDGAARLAQDPELRRKLGRAGHALVSRLYPPSREIEGISTSTRRRPTFVPGAEA
jgi:hypothetical protein